MGRIARGSLVLLLLVGSPAWAGKKKRPAAEAAAPAAVVDAPVRLPCDWPAETAFTYRYEHVTADARQPLLAQARRWGQLTVTFTGAGHPHEVDYELGRTLIEGPPDAVAALAALAGGELGPAVPMSLVLTDGSITRLANQEAVVAAAEPVVRKVTAGKPSQVVEQTLAVLRDPVTGPALLLREPSMFFRLHCVEMTRGQVIESASAHPNPFGGEPLPGTSRVTLTAHDPVAGTVTFETHEATDPAAVEKLVTGLFDKTGAAMDEATRAQVVAAAPPIENVSAGTMVYSLADGFPVSIEVHSEVGAEDHPQRRSDTWTWKRTPSP